MAAHTISPAKKDYLATRADAELVAAVDAVAEDMGETRSLVVREACREYVERHAGRRQRPL